MRSGFRIESIDDREAITETARALGVDVALLDKVMRAARAGYHGTGDGTRGCVDRDFRALEITHDGAGWTIGRPEVRA